MTNHMGIPSKTKTPKLLAVFGALCLAIAGLVAPSMPAQAALHSIFPADADGTPQGVFYADSALFVTTISDLSGGVVCVIPEDADFVTSDCLEGGYSWALPQTYIGIGTLAGYPFAAPPLPVGRWRLLVTDTSGSVSSEASEVFEVRPCRGTCNTQAAASQLQPWKDRAANANSTVETLKYIDAASKSMKLFNDMSGVLTDVVKGGGPVGVIMGIGTGMVEGMFANPWDASRDQAMSILRPLHTTSSRMWADIAADPPRYDYDLEAQPVFGMVPTLVSDDFEPALTAPELETVNQYALLTMEAAAYGDASRIANERYQGALEDEAYEDATRQASATSNLTFELNKRLRALKVIQPQISAMAWAQQPVFPNAEEMFDVPEGQDLDTFFQSLLDQATSTFQGGVPEELRTELLTCDFYETPPDTCPITQDMITYSENLWSDPEWLAGWADFDVALTPAQVLSDYTSELEQLIPVYDLFGRWMGLKAGEAQVQIPEVTPNQQPISSFTKSASLGAAPLTVQFTSTATDPDGDALELKWDIGGTKIVENETTVTHTFTQPGTYWISLVATDPGGLWHQDIQKVEVYPGSDPGTGENQEPIANFEPRTVVRNGSFTETFSATSTDPDGDTLTHTWYFGDGTVYEGDSVTKNFTEGLEMSVLLVASDGKASSTASGSVTANWSDGDPPLLNQAPLATFVADPPTGAAPLQVMFTSNSTDPDGDSLTHHWDFGDGQADAGNKKVVAHTYSQVGTYTVTLTVSDGQAATTTTSAVTVGNQVQPLEAAFTVGGSYDSASAMNGARILDTGVPFQTGYPPTNLISPGSSVWWVPGARGFQQTIIIELAGNGRGLVDQIEVESEAGIYGLGEFSVGISKTNNPFGEYYTLLDHQPLAGSETFPVTPTQGKYLKFTTHNNRGGSYMRVQGLRAHTAGEPGAIVSASGGYGAEILGSPGSYAGSVPENLLSSSNSYWATAFGQVTNQAARVKLGGTSSHTIDRFSFRTRGTATSARNVEVWLSPTGEEGTFTTRLLSAELASNTSTQTFILPEPTVAKYLEVRLLDNYGSPSYVDLVEFQAITTHGLNAATSTPFGSQVIGVSGEIYPVAGIFALQEGTTRWMASDAQPNFTIILNNGNPYVIDRVMMRTYANSHPKTVEIQVSLDGENFTTVGNKEMQRTAGEQWLTFDPVPARFVRFVALEKYDANVSLEKFQVFSVDRGGPTTTFTDLSSGNPVSWAWDFGDGNTSTQRFPTHTFATAGTYEVTLTVADEGGATSSTQRPYTVAGTPTITFTGIGAEEDPNGDLVANEDAYVTLNTTIEGDSGAAYFEWEWPNSRALTGANTASPRAYAPNQGRYPIRVRATTPDGLKTDWTTRYLKSLNMDPTLNIGSARTGLALDPISLAATTITDSTYDQATLKCTINWGDGTAPETVSPCNYPGAINAKSHTYTDVGEHTVTVTASDSGNLGPDGLTYGAAGTKTQTTTITTNTRATFQQVTDVSRNGTDLHATVRLLDAHNGAGLAGLPLTVSAAGVDATQDTNEDGYASVTLEGASAATDLTAVFPGSPVYQTATISRAVRAPKTDIVFVVDESGSMASFQAAVRNNLRTIVNGLGSHLDYNIGVVGYANSPVQHGSGDGHVHTPLTQDVSKVYEGVGNLVAGFGNANPYDGIVTGSGFKLIDNDPDKDIEPSNSMDFRNGAASCMVLISDAGIDEATGTVAKTRMNHAQSALAKRGTTLFTIVMTNSQSMNDALGAGGGLAGQTGGDAWSIYTFVNDPTAVLEALISKCTTKALTPDLAVTVGAPSAPIPALNNGTFTVRAANTAAIDVPDVAAKVVLPAGLAFVSADAGGTYDADTRTVTWPLFDLEAAQTRDFTVTVRMLAGGREPGDYPFNVAASIDYDGSLGAEGNLDNNVAQATLMFQVTEVLPPDPEPEPAFGDVSISLAGLPASTGILAGTSLTYTMDVSHRGSDGTRNTVLLQKVHDRLTVTALDLPLGWLNENRPALVGPHPDGVTPGDWLHLSADVIGPGYTNSIKVTAEVSSLPPPVVVQDEGDLTNNLPTPATLVPANVELEACITSSLNDDKTNDCSSMAAPIAEINAKVTSRLSGGITYLIVSVATPPFLSGHPVTMTWSPSPSGLAAGLEPFQVIGLVPGENRIVLWPGAEFTDSGAVKQWPGWRMVTDPDFSSDGAVLHPLTHEVMTPDQKAELYRGTRIFHASLPQASWRETSTVVFSVVPEAPPEAGGWEEASVAALVDYREVVPMEIVPDPDPTPTPKPDPDPTPTPDPKPNPAPWPAPSPSTPTQPSLPGGQSPVIATTPAVDVIPDNTIAVTGPVALSIVFIAGMVLVLTGGQMRWSRRRERR